MALALSLHSTRSASIDLLRSRDASLAVQFVSIVGFALLTAMGAQVSLYLWEVPFTLQSVAVYGSGLFLGWRNGLLAQVLYIVLGLFFPVFAGDTFGPAYLFTAVTAGYIFSWPFVAMLVGWTSKRWNTLPGSIASMVIGSVLMFTIGVFWLHGAAGHETWFESFDKGWLRFIPADLAKIFFTGLLYTGLRRITTR